ncbi:MAG: hypothetical protein Q8Q89_03305 [bacterium]|nr:hypothetical protein [bacterium]
MGGFTNVSYVAISYIPTTDQEVCTVKPGLYKSGNPTDEVVMTVKDGSTTLAMVTLPASQVADPPLLPQQAVYTEFKFSPCLNLSAGVRYFFKISRTQIGSSGEYVSQLSNLIWYSEVSFWGYVPVQGFEEKPAGYEPALRLEGPDAPALEPVIIVPGILGSRLNRVGDGEEVWPSIGQMLVPGADDYLDELKFDVNGEEVLDINSSEIIESVLSLNQYGNLIQKFKDAGYRLGQDLFVFPYDWRLDVEISSVEFGLIMDQLISSSPTGQVNIVAHSMGGLVVKDYLSDNGDSEVNKLIFAGTPHLGAPKAFNALNYGDDFDLKFIGLGLNKNKAKDISQNMPAVYELLPSREYINQADSYVQNNELADLDYDQTKQLMASGPLLPDNRNSNLLDLADQFHQLHDYWLPQSANVYNLMGCREYDTIGSFQIDDDGSVDINSVNGDGTVPLISASQVPGDDYFVSYPMTKINHTGLISDDRMIDLIYDFISSSNEPVLPPGVYKTSTECDEIIEQIKRLRFSTHSPVNLHVYDSSGNHTGLTPEGNIETNIPDSDLVQVGDNTFIFVPDEAEYSVNIDAYATGSFDFKIKELENGQVSELVIYNNIPINDAELEADLEFISIASQSYLDVDENGDGEFDLGYSPDGSKILYHDEEAPIITLTSPMAGEYERSASISVDFSVTDNSGFFYATASYDGFVLASPSIDLFFSPLGSHSFVVNAQDEAGNKSSKSVDFVSVATYESTISDINRAYDLGWISTERERNSYIRKLEKAIKIEKKIAVILDKLPDGSRREKRIIRLEKRLDRLLAIQFLKDLEKDYNKGRINERAYNLIKEDILWLLAN